MLQYRGGLAFFYTQGGHKLRFFTRRNAQFVTVGIIDKEVVYECSDEAEDENPSRR
jgi:hypothetical protein